MARITRDSLSLEEFGQYDEFKFFEEDILNIKAKRFNWPKEFLNNKTANRVTFIKTCNNITSDFFKKMVDHKLFKSIFTPPVIQIYMSEPDYTFGKPIYDQTLRFHTGLLSGFYHFHLLYDFRFHQKIDTLKIGIMDPFYRQKIRSQNLQFLTQKKKYESAEFSLKNLVKICLQNYFPNVGWRWIGAGHHAHVWTLRIIVMTLELGLWEAWEIRDLLREIYNKADCLNKLEGFLCVDVGAGRVKGAF